MKTQKSTRLPVASRGYYVNRRCTQTGNMKQFHEFSRKRFNHREHGDTEIH